MKRKMTIDNDSGNNCDIESKTMTITPTSAVPMTAVEDDNDVPDENVAGEDGRLSGPSGELDRDLHLCGHLCLHHHRLC